MKKTKILIINQEEAPELVAACKEAIELSEALSLALTGDSLLDENHPDQTVLNLSKSLEKFLSMASSFPELLAASKECLESLKGLSWALTGEAAFDEMNPEATIQKLTIAINKVETI